MAGDVLIDKRIRRNENIIADGNVTRNRGVNAQIDTVTYRGNALSFSAVFLADGAPLVNIDVAPQLSIHVDRDSIGMADIDPSPIWVDGEISSPHFLERCFLGSVKISFRNPPAWHILR